MARILLYPDARSRPEPVALAELDRRLSPGSLAWAGLGADEHAALAHLSDLLGLSRERAAEALRPRHRPHLWRDEGSLSLVVRAPRGERGARDLAPLAVFASQTLLVTVGPDVAGAFDPARPHQDVRSLLHALLEWLAAGYHEAALDIDDESDAVEDMLFQEGRTEIALVQRRGHELRKRLVLLRRAVLPLREMLDSLLSTSLNLEQARLNVTMKKLTGWAAVVAVPTVISGWYGMNVPLPWQGSVWGTVLANAVLVVAAVGTYLSFRRRDWL